MIKKFGLALALALGLAGAASAQVAGQLPLAETQFTDANGAPLASGQVGFYVPGTLTPKTTWSNSTETTPNTNPVVLDAAGRAIIYGSGTYREIVKDNFGNTIWDQLTTDPSSFVNQNVAQPTVTSTIATMETLSGVSYPYVLVNGYNSGTQTGGGYFIWNASSSATPDSCTVFPGSGGSGVSGRYVRVMLQNTPLTPQMCGAYGNGSTLDTAAIQAAMDYVIATSNGTNTGSLYFPCGQYLIGSPGIIVERLNAAYGYKIFGENQECAQIVQGTVNQPVFNFTSNSGSHSFSIGDLFLTSTAAAGNTTASTSAVGVLFAPSNGNAVSFYHFQLHDLHFDYLYRAISDDVGTTANQARLWGFRIENNWQERHMLGAFFYMNSGTGEPRNTFRNNYIISGSGGSYPAWSEPLIYDVDSEELLLEQTEFNNQACTSASAPCLGQFASGTELDNTHVESITVASGANLFLNAGGVWNVRNFDVSLAANPPGSTIEWAFYLNGVLATNPAVINFDGVSLGNVGSSSGYSGGYFGLYAAASQYVNVGRLTGWWNPPVSGTNYVYETPPPTSGYYVLPTITSDVESSNNVCVLYDDGTCYSHGGNHLLGTAGATNTITLAWPFQRVYAVTSTLTANVAITLGNPPTALQASSGNTNVTFVRYNATPGNYTLAVTGTGNTLTNTVNKNGSVNMIYNQANSALGWIASAQSPAYQ